MTVNKHPLFHFRYVQWADSHFWNTHNSYHNPNSYHNAYHNANGSLRDPHNTSRWQCGGGRRRGQLRHNAWDHAGRSAASCDCHIYTWREAMDAHLAPNLFSQFWGFTCVLLCHHGCSWGIFYYYMSRGVSNLFRGVTWFVAQTNMLAVWITTMRHVIASYEEYTTPRLMTHSGRVTHTCVSKLTIIGSDNGLSPGRRQAIIWTNAGIWLIQTSRMNFSEILSKIHTFSFKKMRLKVSSVKWRPFCFGLNVIMDVYLPP